MNRLLIAARPFVLLKVCALALAAMALTACGTLNGLAGGPSEPLISPRNAVMEAARKIEPVLVEVTALIASGVVSDTIADDIAEHGPTVQRIVAAYFDGAEACVVVETQLVTESATGRECEKSTLSALYDALDGEILAWMIDASARGDQQAAATIGAARLVVSLVPRPVAGGLFPGYRDEPDVPLTLFQAYRAQLKAKFETMVAAAVARPDSAPAS